MPALTVHHLERSRSQRLLWLLEELGLEYAMVTYPRTAEGRAPRELRAIHPLGKSPVLAHGDVVLAESGAVVEYVLDELADGRMRPAPGTEAHRRYRFYLHFAEGSMMAPLLVKLLFSKLRGAVPLLGNVIANKVDGAFTNAEIRSHLGYVEADLEGREWLVGDEPTGADVMMSYPLQAAIERGNLGEPFPRVSAYLERIAARPAYQRAVERGGPFEIPG
ncbi:MAG: glutathione S-transferase [Sandaracinaceae bacterium]|nr:glutathione S-transferase [Sandaracinaceae bacterium]